MSPTTPSTPRTIVFFHAHPDDEAIGTGGTIAKTVAAGDRAVLVLATRGEHGEVADGVLADGETLADRRSSEAAASAAALGVHRLEFLGYIDSGMIGTPENDLPGSFWQASIDEAADRLAAILHAERADALTIYDDNGIYGHPDHLQVHRVGIEAARRAGTPKVFQGTVNRDAIELFRTEDDEAPEFDADFGKPAALITHEIDVSAFTRHKRAALTAHSSQISETDWFLAMPPEKFDEVFAREWFIEVGRPGGAPFAPDLFD